MPTMFDRHFSQIYWHLLSAKVLDAAPRGWDYSRIMPRTRLFIFAALLFAAVQLTAAESSVPALWYQQPAQKCTDALPIGNGRLGAMVFGGMFDERIQFNEDTLWTGKPHDYVRASAGDQLSEIR